MLEVKGLGVRYGERDIVRDASFTARGGEWLMIVGPNGAGKSTLVSAVSQCAPYAGTVLIDGEDARRLKPARLARKLGMLSQRSEIAYAFTVEEIVRMGRYAYAPGLFGARDDECEERVEAALTLTGLQALRRQPTPTLSGGELQRALLAQVFAQNPRLLILDEPTNHLDPAYQRQIFDLIHDWMQKERRAVVTVVHDLSLARAYGTHALLMNEGRILAQGAIRDALTPTLLAEVYGMDVYAWMRRLLSQWEDHKGAVQPHRHAL